MLAEKHLMKLEDYLRTMPDFPIPGIMFKDISPLLKSPQAYEEACKKLAKICEDVDAIVAIDARGFVFAAPVAYMLKKPLVMVRKDGKLPGEVIKKEFTYDYASAVLEVQVDAFEEGQTVCVIDDVLATGSTLLTACELIKSAGAVPKKVACILEVAGMSGRKTLESSVEVEALLYL